MQKPMQMRLKSDGNMGGERLGLGLGTWGQGKGSWVALGTEKGWVPGTWRWSQAPGGAPGHLERVMVPGALRVTGKLTCIGAHFLAGKGRPRLHSPSLHSSGCFLRR